MSNLTETNPFLSRVPVRRNFYRDNFRRFMWVNLFLCGILVFLVGYLFFAFQTWTLAPAQFYATTTNGRLIPLSEYTP
jgi:hypothetical protein